MTTNRLRNSNLLPHTLRGQDKLACQIYSSGVSQVGSLMPRSIVESQVRDDTIRVGTENLQNLPDGRVLLSLTTHCLA